MSVLDSIDDLLTDTSLTVRRTTHGTPVHGIFPVGTTTTFTIDAVIQPAYNINRVVGGADMHALVDLQKTTDVRQLHTRTLLLPQSPTTNPDIIVGYQGADWTVIRVEQWNLTGEIHYHCIISKRTQGAS